MQPNLYEEVPFFLLWQMLVFVIFLQPETVGKASTHNGYNTLKDQENPITQAIAAILANGCVNDRKPITVSRIPNTVNQPQPLIPSF